MDLTQFSDELKQDIETKKQLQKSAYLNQMRAEGKGDYEIARKMEQMNMKPDKLVRADAADVQLTFGVKFVFNREDFELFKRHFDVLEYQGLNTKDNWLLLGLLTLIEDGKIQYSEESKEIWTV